MQPQISLGLSDFKKLREQGFYYVDKSLFIAEVLQRSSEVLLLPRPRRFGKTLNLSMLRWFFEQSAQSAAHLFEGLAVADDAGAMRHQGQYPVIYLTFKDCKAASAQEAFRKIGRLFSDLYRDHKPRLYSMLDKEEQQRYQSIIANEADTVAWQDALAFLMALLHRNSGKQAVVLIDEYDTPIHSAHEYGYYDDMVLFMRGMLGKALKDNNDLLRSVLTGILRIAKESIFSDLNNLLACSLLSTHFQDCFGFTETEVERLIADFDAADGEDIKIWYDGYRFGKRTIYNPWSVLNFLVSGDPGPKPYWINTGGNTLLRRLLTRTDPRFQTHIETLLAGGTVTTPLNENAVLRDLGANDVNIWSLLVFSGYLKPVSAALREDEWIYELAIPNREVRSFYRIILRDWIRQKAGSRIDDLLHALLQADWRSFGKLLRDTVTAVLSYHDTAGDEPERVYHAFVLGLLTHLSDRYHIRSNRESGYGRYDMLMIPRNSGAPGFVFEFKKVDYPDDADAKAAMRSALLQIRQRDYAAELREHGITAIWGVGVVVEGKTVRTESVLLK
ncbi:MAG: AAA family ATPase [bacterium]|nr:AAA family ATPase [bacterium]